MMDTTNQPAKRFAVKGWDVLRVGLGVLLLTAAALKLATGNPMEISIFPALPAEIVWIAVIGWEFILAFWLLLRRPQFGAWLAVIITFFGFACASAYQGYIGATSCGCLGSVELNPWIEFGFVVITITGLCFLRPKLPTYRELRSRDFVDQFASGAAYVLGFGGVLITVSGCLQAVYGSSEIARARIRGESLIVTPSRLNLGTAEVDEKLLTTIEVRNLSDHPIRLVGGTSDCSCVITMGMPVTIPSGQVANVPLEVRVVMTANGAFRRSAVIWTDDHGQRTLPITLSAKLR